MGLQAWIDPVKRVAYVLMGPRSNFSNRDTSAREDSSSTNVMVILIVT